MTAIELKKQLIDRIAVIDDVSFLKAIKTILDAKSSSQKLSLTDNQISEILESKKQIASGLVAKQDEIDKKFDKWLNEK
jgi:glycerol-3-phosphate responsive antiterminator